MTIEQVIRVVFDDSAYTRNVAQAATATGNFDARVSSVQASLAALTSAASRSGSAQALAANSAGAFFAALDKQSQTLSRQSGVIGKTESDLLRLKAAELGVATQAEATIAALENQSNAVTRLGAGARAVENIRNLAGLKSEQQALEAGIAIDLRAGRAKEQLIAQIERETAALTRLAAVPRGDAAATTGRVPTGSAAEQVQVAAAQDPQFAARAQPALANLGAAQAARDEQLYLQALRNTAEAAGKTRAELLLLQLQRSNLSAAGRKEAEALIAKLAATDRAFQGFRRTNRLTALELQQVGFQLNDLFVQIASGGNPFVALVQQGSQLSGTFGGIGNAVRALRSLITPTVVALGGLAAGVGVFALAASSTERWTRSLADLQAALQGTGRGGQFSNTALSQLIEQLSQAPGITRDAATKSIAELSRASKIGADLFVDVSRAAVDFARITGADLPAATKTLATALSDPAAGVKSLADALGTLSAGTIATVQRLERLGDRLGAQRTLLDAITAATRGAAESGLTPLQRATNDLGNSWDRLMGTFRESQGLQQALGYVSKLVAGVSDAIRFLDDLDKKLLPNTGSLNPAFDIGAAAGARTRRFLGLSDVTPGGGGRFDAARGGGASFDGPGGGGGSFGDGPEVGIRSESQARDDLLKRVQAASTGYKTEAREIETLKARRDELTKAIRVAAQQGNAPTSPLVLDFQDELAAVNKRIAEAGKRRGGAGDIDRELLRSTAAAIEQARRSAQAQVAVIADQNEELRGQYEAGLIDVATYYRRREELAAEAAAVQQQRLDAEQAAQQRRLTEGRREETRAAASDALLTFPDLRDTAAAEAARASRKLQNEESRETVRLKRQIADIDAEIAQLAGDELAAERQRNQTIVERIRLSAQQNFPVGSPEIDARVAAAERLLDRQSAFNELQRESSALSERAAIAEQNYLSAAQARGDSQEEIERGLFSLRQQLLGQLDELARKARELAQNSTDPRVLLFAEQMALAYRRAIDEIEPGLAKMRSAVDEAAQAVGDAGGAIVLNFRNAKEAVDSLEQSLLRIGNKVLIEEPLTNFARGAFRSVSEGQGAAGDFLRGIFGVSGTRGGGPSVVDTSGAGTVDVPSAARDALRQLEGSVGGVDKAMVELATSSSASSTVLSLLPQAAAIPATTGMAAVGAAAPAAATGLASVAASATAAAAALATIGASSAGSNALSLFGGGGGFGTGANFGNLDFAQFFDEGGYTGDGPASQPAGIVHKGEHVMPQARVAEPGALQFLETVRAVGFGRALEAMSPTSALMAVDPAASSPAAGIGGLSAASVLGGTDSMSMVERIAASAGDRSQIIVGGFTGLGSAMDPAGFVDGGVYVTPMDRVRETGALQFLENMREMGLAGALRAAASSDAMPGFASGGLVGGYAGGGLVQSGGNEWLPLAERLAPQAAPTSQASGSNTAGKQITVNVQVSPPPGASRETALQFGRTVGGQVRLALARNG